MMFLSKFGDLESWWGLLAALAAPMCAATAAAVLLVADFGATSPSADPQRVTAATAEYLQENVTKADPRTIFSIFSRTDGTRESRLVIRTASSSRDFSKPIYDATGMVLAAFACILAGAGATIKVFGHFDGALAQSPTYKFAYPPVRRFVQALTWVCTGYIGYSIVALGLWPLVSAVLGALN